ncbi:hypothetical protein LEP1GSC193_4252 [Leptospira alstonii serovar Pingchang str. 80-412]|uniref:Uncharacterized protein n=2 Tax=Leptospira alstonii TaxID=28452 RepID=M6CW48_9LEPT|nr:hypothetical protein LEP1GSC194_1911 [Leptospira alstonii serovar Sichuan str. 79601]EQA78407.1 hypothetical protein LEP1GSC193_4252 [Leptospira alstonii serovar Pingchang str. 80-412]
MSTRFGGRDGSRVRRRIYYESSIHLNFSYLYESDKILIADIRK